MGPLNVLLLSPYPENLLPAFERDGDQVRCWQEPIKGGDDMLQDVDFIVSYGYQHILRADVLDRFENRIINLHISYLPHNRGSDPNLWSWLTDSPKGVTIHQMDAGLDTGDILVQKEVRFQNQGETLATSYQKLRDSIESLFIENWSAIRAGKIKATPQKHEEASLHRVKDKFAYFKPGELSYERPIDELVDIFHKRRQG